MYWRCSLRYDLVRPNILPMAAAVGRNGHHLESFAHGTVAVIYPHHGAGYCYWTRRCKLQAGFKSNDCSETASTRKLKEYKDSGPCYPILLGCGYPTWSTSMVMDHIHTSGAFAAPKHVGLGRWEGICLFFICADQSLNEL